ncbi:uncharacterized protein LOC131236276 [Magnolia sinica]|uniref:uncharacterized protein LOC131236276 n=1 Tax=Magnolia sinica TaxID=86752 RepID=UPI00265A2034|nr:uncharacterized protein LOC131236276 [Magnolia sinica]
MAFMRKLKRGYLNNSIALVCVIVSASCLLVLLVSMLRLPEISLERGRIRSPRLLKFGKRLEEEERLGKLAEVVFGMLPDDLAFTIFIPSEEAFERDVKLWANDSLVEQKANDTFAILSRLLAFSTVPQHLPFFEIPLDREISLDSISGFRLYALRTSDGTLVVNNIQSEWVDLRKGKIIVHVMSGVIMDAEFEQSFRPDYDDED